MKLRTDQGWKREWAYDANSRVTTLTEKNALGALVFTMVDTWDATGTKGYKSKSVRDSVTTDYTMDDSYRLTGQQTTGAWATFAYDSRGNITVKEHEGSNLIAMTVDAANRLVTALSGTSKITYSYDDNGNMTQEQTNLTVNWAYDDEDRMSVETQVVVINGVTTNIYSGDGLRRTTKKQGSNTVTFVWDGSDYLKEYS